LLGTNLTGSQLLLFWGNLEGSKIVRLWYTKGKGWWQACTDTLTTKQNKKEKNLTLTSHDKKHLSSIRGHHWLRSQFISFNALTFKQGSLHRRTTTFSAFAEIKPRRNTFRQPQL
jgi:hypothetical protein